MQNYTFPYNFASKNYTFPYRGASYVHKKPPATFGVAGGLNKRVRYLFREKMLRMSALVMPVTFIEKFS